MIDVKRTWEVYKVEVSSLAPTSNQMVCWKCDSCGNPKDFSYAYCRRKAVKAAADNEGVEQCQKCAHAHRKGKVTVKSNTEKSYVDLPPEVDIAATVEQFGHDPRSLSPWSRERIVVRCQVTGQVCTPRRCGLNRYKSILETGHFVSIGAWTAKRRKGVKASDETKESMKKSQQSRRQKEKVVEPAAGTQISATVVPTAKSEVKI